MDDFAHERPAAIDFSDAVMEFVGSRTLLSDVEIGSRVRYEGKVVY